MASQCCNYIDGGSCTDDCGIDKTANSTFHCVDDNNTEDNVGMLIII